MKIQGVVGCGRVRSHRPRERVRLPRCERELRTRCRRRRHPRDRQSSCCELSQHDVVARVGSEDFAVLAELAGTDEAFAARALDAFRAPFLIGGSLLNVEGRVGIARSPEHGDSSAMLMSAAESAARSARRMAAGWALASSTRSRDSADRLQMLGDLRQALERNELRLHYQPMLDVTSRKVVGFEALMRWQRNGELVAAGAIHPARGAGRTHRAAHGLGRWRGDAPERRVGQRGASAARSASTSAPRLLVLRRISRP